MNCVIVDNCDVTLKLLKEFVGKSPCLRLITAFSDPSEAKKYVLNHNDLDLIILDIQNPDSEGFNFVSDLNIHSNIIMISSSGRYALEAFDLNVIDYLIKPFSYWRFCKAIDRAARRFDQKEVTNKGDEEVFVKKGSSLIKLRLKEIIYVEALENYVTLYSKNGRFIIHTTMKAMENQLPSEIFNRVHRSLIINKNMIQAINEDSLNLNVGSYIKNFPLGKTFRHSVLNNVDVLVK